MSSTRRWPSPVSRIPIERAGRGPVGLCREQGGNVQAAVDHGGDDLPHGVDRHRGGAGHCVVGAALARHRGRQEHPPGMAQDA